MIHLFTIGFGRPDLLPEQKRLCMKYLKDEFILHLVDNSVNEKAAEMRQVADLYAIEYLRPPSQVHEHPEALNYAAEIAFNRGYEYYMFLDHDVFLRKKARIAPVLRRVGFYGIGQFHSPTRSQYIWPGLFGVSKVWLADRRLDFGGIRGERKRDDGDCGSLNAPLFRDEDWRNLHGILDHGYGFLRAPDSHGLQSFGYEQMGPWLHLTNSSHWMVIPNPEERDRLATELIRSL